MNIDDALRGTAADPSIARILNQPVATCVRILGKWPADGYQFQDNNGMARCAYGRPCPIHDRALAPRQENKS